jgi:nucleotide-binding universal stress UspA family protein
MATEYRRPIVVGVSRTDTANDVVAWGARQALLRHRPLRLVHAYGTPAVAGKGGRAAPAASRQAYREAAEWVHAQRAYALRLLPGGEVETTVRDGTWVEVLLQQASDAELLVVGTGDERRTEGLATARGVQLVAHAGVPVLLVRGTGLPGAHGTGRIVAGCDERSAPDALFAAAFDEADRRGVGLVVVSAGVSGLAPSDTAGPAEALIGDALIGWRGKYPQVPTDHRVSQASPAAALVEASAGAELLVVGDRGSGGFPGLRLGSVTDALLRHAECPVLVVPLDPR